MDTHDITRNKAKAAPFVAYVGQSAVQRINSKDSNRRLISGIPTYDTKMFTVSRISTNRLKAIYAPRGKHNDHWKELEPKASSTRGVALGSVFGLNSLIKYMDYLQFG